MAEAEALNEITVEVVNDISQVSVGQKRTREGKLRSKAWDHFTKLIKEDGTAEKCQCNHCHKLFTCAGKTGTTHLLRHITEGSCSVHNKDKKERPPKHKTFNSRIRNSETRGTVAWKYDQVVGQTSQQFDLQDDILPLDFDDIECQVTDSLEAEYIDQSPLPVSEKHPQLPALKSQPRGESWMKDLRACVGRLAELTSVAVPKMNPDMPCSNVAPPDYSISTAVRCLNEMEDIPQSSEMYLDAFEVLKDEGERECFICLPPEPRRRWLQRMLLRHYPLRYDHDS